LKSSRALAARILRPLLSESPSGNLSEQFNTHLNTDNDKDQGLIKELCFGVCRHYLYLQAITQSLLAKPLKKKDKDIELLILIGLYQLKFLRTPDHAAINETVSGCIALKKPWAKGLINGVLRRFLRDQNNIENGISKKLSTQTSHPSWLVASLEKDWPQHCADILEANNAPAPLTLRVNSLKGSVSEYLETLSNAGIQAQACDFSKDGSYNSNIKGVLTIHGVAQEIITKATFEVKKGTVVSSSKIMVNLDDYKIEVPNVVKDKISKELEVKMTMNFVERK